MPYLNHPNFNQYVNPQEVDVWCYLKLNSLLKILSNQTMRFAKITQCDDLREGHVEPSTQETLSAELGGKPIPQYLVDGMNNLRSQAKHKMFGNCWCAYDEEINVMWDSYGSSHENNIGVAIKTTADVLYSSIIDTRQVYSGVVTYEKFPFTPKSGNEYIDSVVKMSNYSLEKELRLFYIGEDLEANSDNL